MVPVPLQLLDRGERRSALLQGMAAIAAVGALDLLVSGVGGPRLGLWVGWIAIFALAASVITRGPPLVPVVCGAVTGLGSVGALLTLAALGGGATSPYFVVVTMIPLLMVVVAPSDIVDAGLAGLAVLGGGAWIQLHAGRSTAEVALWGSTVLVTTTLALTASLRHLRQQGEQLAAQSAQAGMLERLAAAERASALAERWATIGRVADAVAHDVNSPLGALRSNLAYAREELAAGRLEEIDDALVDGQGGVERIREIVASLQAFSRADVEDGEARGLQERAEVAERPGAPAGAERHGAAVLVAEARGRR
jgi:signal transduction histidine kinase